MASTPGPTTRARSRQATPAAGALPALDPKASYGYGARGKATLRTQVMHQDTEFDTAFQGAAYGSRVAPGRPEMDGDNDDDDDDDDNGRSQRGTAPLRRRLAASSRTGRQPAMATLAEGGEGVVDRTETVVEPRGYDGRVLPSAVEVTAHTIPRYVPRVVRDGLKMGMFLLGCAVFLLALLRAIVFIVPSTAQTLALLGSSIGVGWRLFWQVPPFNTTAETLEAEWLAFKYEKMTEPIPAGTDLTQKQWNALTIGRVRDLEKRMGRAEKRLNMHDDSFKIFSDFLPQSILVQTKDGRWVFPDPFWAALHEGLTSNDSNRAPLWQHFLSDNEAKLDAYYQESANQVVQQYIQNKTIITSDMLQTELGNRYSYLAREHASELQKIEQRLLNELQSQFVKSAESIQADHFAVVEDLRTQTRAVADQALDEARKKIPNKILAEMQVMSLTYMNILENTQQALQSVNFFSPGLGARIDPHLTSPTRFDPTIGWLPWLFGMPHIKPNPPIAALMHWEEATECWCATVTSRTYTACDDGSKYVDCPVHESQIAIKMAHKIYPETLVIEHAHRRGTLDIASAPKDIEVWIDAGSKAKVKEYNEAMELRHIYSEKCLTTPAPSPTHICFMTGTYNIHGRNWIQTFHSSYRAEGYGLATDHVVVRARDNWGRDLHTCFYRLRMTGTLVNAPGRNDSD